MQVGIAEKVAQPGDVVLCTETWKLIADQAIEERFSVDCVRLSALGKKLLLCALTPCLSELMKFIHHKRERKRKKEEAAEQKP